MLSHVKLH